MGLHSRRLIAGVGVVVSLASAVALTACGGGGSGSNTPSAKSTSSAPASAATSSAPAASPASKSTAAASSGGLDVCGMVTKADVEAAIGTSVLDPKPSHFPNYDYCDFNDPAASGLRLVTASVVTGSSASDAKDAFDLSKSNANSPQAVAGLGDDAFWDDTLGTLDIVKGQYEVSVDVAPLDNLDRVAAAKAVAAKVLANLP